MKKMPCLFQRDFSDPRNPRTLDAVTPGCEWALEGIGTASIKRDGTACMVRGGVLFARYDSKIDHKTGKRKVPPPGFEPCDPAPDDVTGHWPGWVPVGTEPLYKWHAAALTRCALSDGTYELCGPHFSANREGFTDDLFIPHGEEVIDLGPAPLTFDSIRRTLAAMQHEGIVFLHPDGQRCKIRRGDLGFPWPVDVDPAP